MNAGAPSARAIETPPSALRLPLALVADSHLRLTGRPLVEAATGTDLAAVLWRAPQAIVAHAGEADPVFFYGNRLALELFEFAFEDFVQLPSRFSAAPLDRDERARLLARVSRDGYIDDYAGVRVARSGRRFRIEQATVWNLVGADGGCHGQAATFARWQRLD